LAEKFPYNNQDRCNLDAAYYHITELILHLLLLDDTLKN
jgi:hypothetical protein